MLLLSYSDDAKTVAMTLKYQSSDVGSRHFYALVTQESNLTDRETIHYNM